MRSAAALALALLSACASAPTAPVDPKDRLVVLISVDGLAAYYLNDPKAPLPTLRRMMREGAVAEGVYSSFPTVTWPNHTTLVTGVEPGKHGVIGNSYLDRSTLEVVKLIPDPLFDKDQLVKVPTLYDAAHRAGLKTAGIIWPASRNAKTLDWTVPDCMTKELWDRYATPGWLEELRKENIPVDMQETWCKANGGVQRDWMYARATAQVIRAHRPNLVLLHLVEVDHVEHAKGPRSPDAYWACSHADDRVRDVVEAVEAAGLRDRTTFFVVSDHGFIAYTKQICPNVELRKAGMVKVEGEKTAPVQAYVVAQGGGAFVYVLDKSVTEKVKSLVGGLEGVSALYDTSKYAEMGIATPTQDPRMPDFVLSAKDGYSFSDVAAGDEAVRAAGKPGEVKGSHGYHPSEPQMFATFIAWGAGIRPGVKLPVIRSVDVAPTIARLLGLRMENLDGKSRDEILTSP